MASGRRACRKQRILLHEVLKKMKKTLFLTMTHHILSLIMSLMILFVISAYQNPMLNSWHPGWRTRTSSLIVLESHSAEADIKSTPIFSLNRRTVYCTDIGQLLHKVGVTQCQNEDWSLFIYSSKRSMKCVLLYDGNQFASVPMAHLTTLKEKYEAEKYVLVKLRYEQIEWLIGVHLKMVKLLLGQQSAFTKFQRYHGL